MGCCRQVDVFGYLGGSGVAGTVNPNLNCTVLWNRRACPPSTGGYGTALQNLFNNSAPDKGVGFNFTIPLRNRLRSQCRSGR